MFDLNEQIAKWRDELVIRRILQESDIDELENHLRDEIDELSSTKLLPEEVFVIAVNRLGYIDSIVEEYEKINHSTFKLNKVNQIIAGIFFYFVSLFFAKRVVVYCVQIAINNKVYDYSTLALIRFSVELIFVTGMFFSGCLMYKYLIKYSFMKMFINRISERLILLIGLLWLIIYRIGFYIPVHGFRGMDFQPELEQKLRILKLTLLIFIPVIFILITGLKDFTINKGKSAIYLFCFNLWVMSRVIFL